MLSTLYSLWASLSAYQTEAANGIVTYDALIDAAVAMTVACAEAGDWSVTTLDEVVSWWATAIDTERPETEQAAWQLLYETAKDAASTVQKLHGEMPGGWSELVAAFKSAYLGTFPSEAEPGPLESVVDALNNGTTLVHEGLAVGQLLGAFVVLGYFLTQS